MAAKPFSTTRRALLGAAATLPLAAVSAQPPTSFVPGEVEACPEQSRRRRTRWQNRLTRYQRLAKSAKAAAETGWFRAANDRYNREMAALRSRPTRHPGLDPGSTLPSFCAEQEEGGCRIKSGMTKAQEAETARQAAFARVTRAENLYFDRHTAPLLRAATLLAETPAPDLPALLAKIRVMQTNELQEEGALPRPALELLAEDVGRLLR